MNEQEISLVNTLGKPYQKWVEWIHHPMGILHCPTCLKLNGCWFASNAVPKNPQHYKCHCSTTPIPFFEVAMDSKATSDYRKFDPYLFNVNNEYSHKKEKMFNSWGYSVEDARWLQQEMERQAIAKYRAGSYILGKLNEEGQRITILVEIPRKNGEGTVRFQTGWMVYPSGEIRLTTPYGGK